MATPARIRVESVLLAAVHKHTTAVCVVPVTQHSRRPRQIHTTKHQDAASMSPSMSAIRPNSPPASSGNIKATSGVSTAQISALSCLPLSSVLRTYLITSISSSPFLLNTSTVLLRRMLESKNPLLNLRNPLLRSLLYHTFYKQFCMGSSRAEIDKVCSDLRAQGYSGVILEYALEVLKDAEGAEVNEEQDVKIWRKGMLDTVAIAQAGDFVGLKWSGMGPAAMRRMADDAEPTERMSEAMHALCSAAKEKNVSLLPAAEETWSLTGFHNWSLKMQRVYNLNGKSVVYSTYQAYLKQTPATVARHLELAQKENFTLGLKLVRGAYLGSEKRELIHPSIEATHEAYDGIAAALILRERNSWVDAPAATAWPKTNVMLATHNAISVSRAQALRQQQAASRQSLTTLTFAQLQGMADEVSCTLVAAAKAAEVAGGKAVREKVFKCSTWGTMTECLNYLLRRAAENKDAAGRTVDTRRAMGREILRRGRGVVGMN
ncbi:hypothetical protein LTR62_005698 [Meristemomyces frigidus]|uniref:Proline dehydrogenase n=1 Tax=Meristemomyces frigidus TaxID=1508187 RepID=A0AAN7TKL8_9PEZI|nr:hypothetical protein LTR62_005698 [Meristemomyces frigidus]